MLTDDKLGKEGGVQKLAASPRPWSPRRQPPDVPRLDLGALAAQTQSRAPRPKSARNPSRSDGELAAAPADPFEIAYDLLRAGLTSTSDAVLALRARPLDGAALLGEPSCGVLLGSPPYPLWLRLWVPPQSTVLCYNATAALVLGVLCRDLVGADCAPQLDAAAAVIDAVLRPPSHCALQVLAWRGLGVRIDAFAPFDSLERIGALPVPPCPEPDGDRAEPCHRRLLRAAGMLAQARSDKAAAALGLPEQYVRALIETHLAPGRVHAVTPPAVRAPGATDDCDAALAERYAVAGALLYAIAVDDAVAEANAQLPPPPTPPRPADVELVLAPRHAWSPLARHARAMCDHLLQENESQLLSGRCAAALPPPAAPELRLDDQAERAALINELGEAVNDLVDAAFDQRDQLLPAITEALQGRRPLLHIDRTACRSTVRRLARGAAQVLEAIDAADCMVVQRACGGADAAVLDEAGVGAALARCARTFPWRLTLAEFMRTYAPLVAESCGGALPAVEAVQRICGASCRVVGQMVLLDAATHDQLNARLARLRPECQRLADALAMERERLCAAFPEEYGWLDAAGVAAMGGRLTTPRAAAPDRVHQLVEFMRGAALGPTRAAGPGSRVPLAVALCARVLRARGWRDLVALCEAVRHVHADRAQAPLQRAAALMRLADVCAIAYAQAQACSSESDACESALQIALRNAAALVADSLLRIMVQTPDSLARALAGALGECCAPTVALRGDRARAVLEELIAVRFANLYAAREERGEPVAMIAAMSAPDVPPDVRWRLKLVAQCLVQRSRAAGAGPPTLPTGFSAAWVRSGEGEPCETPTLPHAADLVCATFDRAQFAALCAGATPAPRK